MKKQDENQKRIDWSFVKEWIENNWTFQEGCVVWNPDHIDEMAIGIAGELDNYINGKYKELIYEIKSNAESTTIYEKIEDVKGWIIKDDDLLEIEDRWVDKK